MLGPDYVKPTPEERRKRKLVRFRFLRSALGIVTVALLTITLAGFAGSLGHSFELISHFKVQLLVLALVCVMAALLLREKRWGWVAWAVVVLNGAAVAPWYLGKPTAPEGSGFTDVKFLLSNVLTSNTNSRPFLELVQTEQPDVVVLQEVNQRWMNDLAALETQYPHRKVVTRSDNFGIAVLSKKPLANDISWEIGNTGVPSITTDIRLGNAFMSLVATHPLPPVNTEYMAQRNKQLEALGPVIKERKRPTVLLGDLNVTMWSPYYSQLIQDTGLKNARQGYGVLPTWPADVPVLLIPLDHCLVSPDIAVRNIHTGPNIGSDHRPLIVTLAIPTNSQ